LDQRNFAVFIEDWAQVLNAFDENNNVIDIKDALVAVRNMQIEASTTSNAEVENTRQVQSEMAQIAASAKKGVLPAYFTIQDSAYLGLAEREIKLRLIVNSTGSTPQFAIQIVKEELLRNEIIEDFKEEVIALLPENPVRIGSFKS
ncbi:YfdQ family protein, partial [Acinetobacter baumannii]